MTTRVLWVVKGLGPGGVEKLLAASARALDSESFTVDCVYVLPFKDHVVGELEAAGVRCRCVGNSPHDPLWPLRLTALVRRGNYDVVHTHSPVPGSVARIAARIPGSGRPALISTVHNTWRSFRRPTHWLTAVTSPLDDESFAVSDEVASSMTRVVRRRTSTLTHGIDVVATAAVGRRRQEMRAELGLTDEHIVVGTVANMRAQKDYPNFLKAAAVASATNTHLRFVAVGQGPLLDDVRALATDLGLDDVVTITGYRADATTVMAALDVFTMASAWEGLPVAVMEACALGLPIAATNVGGMAEALTNESNALLVPPQDPEALAAAWLRLADNPKLRTTLGEASRQLGGSFDVRQAQATLEDAYRRYTSLIQPNDRDSDDGDSPGTKASISTTTRRRPPALNIRPATPDDRPAILELLRHAMGRPDDPRYAHIYAWKHDTNVFGPSPTWVAVGEGRVVAVRVFMRWEFVRDGQVLRAVRAVDTATDPSAQGKGLFTDLTMHGLDEMAAEGVDFVFNTPNERSLAGNLKMGWREVGSVPTTVKARSAASVATMARSRVPATLWSEPLDIGCTIDIWLDGNTWDSEQHATRPRVLATHRTEEFLRWRYGNPLFNYRVVTIGHGAVVVVRKRRRGAAHELVIADVLDQPADMPLRIPTHLLKATACDYALHMGRPNLRDGQFPLPGGGPMLTWRQVTMPGCPPLANWGLQLGDIEMF